MDLRNFIVPDLLALALFVAGWRSRAVAPALPDLRRAPWWLLVAALVVSGAMAWRGTSAIAAIDHELTHADPGRPSSAKLEWVYSPVTAKDVIKQWTAAPSMLERVVTGLRIDTLAFIPFYPIVLFTFSLLVARRWPRRSRACAWGIALAWAGLAAGVLDLFENAGIWLELRRGLTALAPVTATFALLKWIAIALIVYYAIAAAVAAVRRLAANGLQ
jgi:hypothetical protein